MKIIGEESDIVCGAVVGSFSHNERWKICYLAWLETDAPRYVLVSLIDGMVTNEPCTRQELADRLSDGNYVPELLLP